MANFAQLLVILMNFIRVVAICAFPGVTLKMIRCPTFGGVYRARKAFHGVLVEPNIPFLLRSG
jgi:hypothetical protein